MKLYLSSYLLGSSPEHLANLAGENKRAAIVMNASDVFGDAKRPEYFRKYANSLHDIGFEADELDLRRYFGKQEALKERMSEYGLLWVTGGNTFTLRRAMRQSGLDVYLGELLSTTELVYGGFSAGACVLCPSLNGIELADEPETIADGYDEAVIWDGLGLVDFHIVPHYRSDHPESPMMEAVIAYYKEHRMRYETLADGEAIVIDGKTSRRVGEPLKLHT